MKVSAARARALRDASSGVAQEGRLAEITARLNVLSRALARHLWEMGDLLAAARDEVLYAEHNHRSMRAYVRDELALTPKWAEHCLALRDRGGREDVDGVRVGDLFRARR